ncbi:hypothetical protein D9756_006857 [Leucocoprinus leucothites]|uniref:Uncharacterized protein n=1 Tax=Leucocoprinus leucothites TaxID=201217 RepID=A0A8H5G1Z5_9AGAR|nr:hypothetical protein D9756_006857 [Leucoagaricus leucothites]
MGVVKRSRKSLASTSHSDLLKLKFEPKVRRGDGAPPLRSRRPKRPQFRRGSDFMSLEQNQYFSGGVQQVASTTVDEDDKTERLSGVEVTGVLIAEVECDVSMDVEMQALDTAMQKGDENELGTASHNTREDSTRVPESIQGAGPREVTDNETPNPPLFRLSSSLELALTTFGDDFGDNQFSVKTIEHGKDFGLPETRIDSKKRRRDEDLGGCDDDREHSLNVVKLALNIHDHEEVETDVRQPKRHRQDF